MTNPFEFTPAQNLIPALRADGPVWFGRRLWKGYRLPACDANLDRVLDTTEVTQVGTDPAFDEHHHDVKVRLPDDESRWRASWTNAGGVPLQAADPATPVKIRVLESVWVDGRKINTGRVAYSAEVPGPVARYAWVQGNPQPAAQLQGWNDAHVRLINPDGSSTEMIGCLPHHAYGRTHTIDCLALARYSPDGELTGPRDRHVTVWQGRVSELILGRGEVSHRLALIVPGLRDDPSNAHEIGLWVALSHSAVPWDDLTPDAHRVASMLVHHGAITTDHGLHSGVESISGADWIGIDWGGWRPRLGDFRAVLR